MEEKDMMYTAELFDENEKLKAKNAELNNKLKEIKAEFQILENKRISDNNDYISIPVAAWIKFRELVSGEKWDG